MRILFTFLLLMWPWVAAAQDVPTLTVSGEGTVSVAPDIARISMGVSHQAPSADAALDQVITDLAAVFDRLDSAGIAPADVQSTGLRVDVVQDYQSSGGPRVVGYTASSEVTLTVRDLDQLGALIDQVVGDGANQISGLQFDVADPGPHLDEARRAAVADARAKATVLAEAAGLALGPLQSMVEGGGHSQPGPMMEMRTMAESAVPIAQGEITLRAHVTMRYGLE